MQTRRKFLQCIAAAMITAATLTKLAETKLPDCIDGITEANLLDLVESEPVHGKWLYYPDSYTIVDPHLAVRIDSVA